MNSHYDSSFCNILSVHPLGSMQRFLLWIDPIAFRIEARDTTALIKIHQTHSQSHVDIHYDPSRCSMLGLYPFHDELALLSESFRFVRSC